MNYRHGFHAGNFADVLKHMILTALLEALRRKDAPFRVIDTHAGRGWYDLASDEAQRSPEWRDGIGRLWDEPDPPPLVRAWLAAVRAANPDGALSAYPGSPILAREMTRPQDRLRLCELHPVENEHLSAAFAGDRRCKIEQRDGWEAVRAWLPAPERRGLVIVDPPFEKPGEFERLAIAMDDGLARAANLIYLLWRPIKDPASEAGWRARLQSLPRPALDCVLSVADPGERQGLCATGVTVLNPPWLLDEGLSVAGPWLAQRLAQGFGARFVMHSFGPS
jgi:23S rRNA (adenine2030-N6)-methyltransferase